MVYIGSKNRISKDIVAIITKDIEEYNCFIDMFCGGFNIIDKINHSYKIANDSNKYLIALIINLLNGYEYGYIHKEEYDAVRLNRDSYSEWYVGYVGFICSFRGKFFGGYCGEVNTKQGKRNYQLEQYNNIKKQLPHLEDVHFSYLDYKDVIIPDKSIIYCDIPYKDTLKYNKQNFDHNEFYNWCRLQSSKGHKIYISEYNMPEDFTCIWQKEVSSRLNANSKKGYNKITIEKLFTL